MRSTTLGWVRKSFSEEVTSELKPECQEELAIFWGESILAEGIDNLRVQRWEWI